MPVSERETIIRYTEHEDDAQVYTCNRKLQNKIGKMFQPDGGKDVDGGLTFIIPKEYVRVQKPSALTGRVLTEDEKEVVRERFAAGRAAAAKAKGATAKSAVKTTAKVAPKRAAAVVEDEEEDEVVSKPVAKAVAKKGPTVAAKPVSTRKPVAVAEDDEDEEEEDEEVEVVTRRPVRAGR